MDFESAQKYLDTLLSYEALNGYSYDSSNFDLDELKRFVEAFGIDSSKAQFVNVAGSKGKGSVSNLMGAYLSKSGKSVGVFTSPHLVDVRERIVVNGKMITGDKFAEYVLEIKEFMEGHPELKKLTYFEVLTVLALKYFSDEGIEFVILEVGLGGRLDSTNIVKSKVCVLTRVEMEHVGILGDTIEKILNEKLGIFKKGAFLVIGAQSSKVTALLKADLERGRFKGERCRFVEEKELLSKHVDMDFFDEAKLENARTAFTALEVLLGEVDSELFKGVLGTFRLPGRFDVREVMGKVVVLDVAHTVNSIVNLCKALSLSFKGKRFVFLVSLMKGKNVEEIFEVLGDYASRVVFTSSNAKRGYSGNELKDIFSQVVVQNDIPVKVDENTEAAFEVALSDIQGDSVLVVTGSNFLVGRVLKQITKL